MKQEFSFFEFFYILKKQLLVLLRRLLKLLMMFFNLQNLYVAYSKEDKGLSQIFGDGILLGLILETDKVFFLFKGIATFLRGSVADLFSFDRSLSSGFMSYFSHKEVLCLDSINALEQSLHRLLPFSNLCSLMCS